GADERVAAEALHPEPHVAGVHHVVDLGEEVLRSRLPRGTCAGVVVDRHPLAVLPLPLRDADELGGVVKAGLLLVVNRNRAILLHQNALCRCAVHLGYLVMAAGVSYAPRVQCTAGTSTKQPG